MRLAALRALASLALAAALLLAPGRQARAVPSPEGSRLTLMTFNIRFATPLDGANAWEHRRELAARVIRDADPDILALQEALRPQLDDLAGRLPSYAQTGVGRDDGRDGGEHCAILFRADRFRIGSGGEDRGTFWLSDTPELPGSKSWGNHVTRICTWVRLEPTADPGQNAPSLGRPFYIFNTHLDHQSQPSRERAAELIAARIAAREHPGDPVILIGDLNAGETNPVVRYLKGEIPRGQHLEGAAPSPTLRCAFRAANPDARDVGTYHAFRGTTTGDMIDYILVSRGARVLTSAIVRTSEDGRYPSDHFPVTATIELPPPGAE